jgi:hypothetical protein
MKPSLAFCKHFNAVLNSKLPEQIMKTPETIIEIIATDSKKRRGRKPGSKKIPERNTIIIEDKETIMIFD